MNRDQSLQLVKEKIKNQNSIKHCLATEAIMKAIAIHFNENESLWAITGLVHDLDMELVDYVNEPEKHGIVTAEILKENGFSDEIIRAVKSHNPVNGTNPETKLEKAIYCVDPLTGLIVASCLVLPSKKLSDLTSDNVLNRFKEKSFARGADREIISSCSEINLSLEEFVSIGLKAMQGISSDLGL
ncbi:MAG: HD domain-containing protein [Patescibacteria group bacterium]